MVSMANGSPSLRRSLLMVTVTVFVNGSAFSSQTLTKNCFGTEDGVLVVHKGFEHGKLFRREVERPAVAGGFVVQRVELDPGGAEDPGLGGWSAAGESADAEHELGEMERFCEIIVCSEAEAADPLQQEFPTPSASAPWPGSRPR